jgi:two-component system sensor histidine kinase CpxA
MSRIFAPRGLFATIFLWFFAAQLLLGAALYGLAAATQRQFDQSATQMAGRYIQARAYATAVAYELGGIAAARRAWNVESEGDRSGPDGGDGPDGDGPADRGSASLYLLLPGKAPQLLVGPSAPISDERLGAAAQAEESMVAGERGAPWLVRRITTDKAGYLTLVRLRGRNGPPRGFLDGFLGGRPGAGGPFWGVLLRWLVIALVMGALCYALARYLSAPMLQLSHAARRCAEGDLAARVGPKLGRRRDELADLGRDFDLMAQSIESQRANERRLLGDISHELRSPLARLQVALDLAEQGADVQTRGYLARMEEEVEELGTMIGQLLTFTRLENATPTLQAREMVDLLALVTQVCADADFEASGSGRTVTLTKSHPAGVSGNAELLRSAIENVVRNALVHAPNSDVEVSLQTTSDEAIIRVRDHGAGVPEAALEELFQPFYRVATARDRQSGGTGLGLSITQRALTSHGGSVRAANAAGGGLEVKMRLPLARPHQEHEA